MYLRLSSSFHLFLLTILLLVKENRLEERREPRQMSNLVDYWMKALEKPIKGKIDLKTLMPKIPKHIQVYIAVAFSERDFPSYSKVFNKTLSSIPNSFLIPDSLNRHYNISVSPLFFVLPNSGRFSSSIYEVMCNSFDRKRVVAILVIGESPAAFTVSLVSVTSNIPVLWARGGVPSPPGSLQQQDPLEIRLEPSESQLLEAVRGVCLATHWHSFTVVAAPSLAARCASILDKPPLNPKVVSVTKDPHNIFRKLADVSRSTRGVILLLCDLPDAVLVMNVAKRLSMIDGHFVWIWIDTTSKPASFLTLSESVNQNFTQKFTRYLENSSKSRSMREAAFYRKDGDTRQRRSSFESRSAEGGTFWRKPRKVNKREAKVALRDSKGWNVKGGDEFSGSSLLYNRSDSRSGRVHGPKENESMAEHENETSSAGKFRKLSDKGMKFKERGESGSSKWKKRKEEAPDYANDIAVQLDHPGDKKEAEEDNAEVPVSKAWGRITEYFPGSSSGRGNNDDVGLKGSKLPIGLLSVRAEPMKLDRHLVKGSVRLLVGTLQTVLKKSADWLSILDADSSCWTRPSTMNKNFSDMYAREIRQAVKEALSGQPQFQDGDRADRSLLANFQILNLVPEKFNINFNNDVNVIEDAVLYWRQVGKVLGKSAHLDTIVWPGGDLVASALSARTRSVFRIVTALAPPFVMEGALDEDGQCLRGVICHRVLNSDKDNLTLVFNEMDTQERMEDEEEELGGTERTEKPFKLFDHSYFEYHATKHKYKSSCCYGLAMDLLENVAQELEFEFHLYIIPDGAYGAKNHVWEQGGPRSKWNGIVGDLVSGAAHMSFAALSVSKQRSQVIDFSTPYFFSGVSFLAAPTQKSEVPLLAFLLPFSTELWIAIFTSLNITAMAVACYEWLSPFGLNPWGRQRSRNFSIASALWVMWGLLCGHLVAFKAPKSWPNKFLINVWGGFSVIFVASYTANIAALIAGLFFHNSVSDYHDRSLLSQRVGAPKSSSADYYIHRSNQHLWEHMQKYSFKDVETGISLLRNGSLDILIADTPILDYYRATDHGCKLQKIVEGITEDTYAIGMNKGFPLKESISAVIAKYSNNGYMDILTEKWYGGLPCFKMTPSVELTDVGQPRPLGVAAVAGVFLLLGLGMVVGVLILILEHLFYRYTLPVLRHQPKGTIWRSRNIMFFSQKLYRFINCVELVSPHHAARELVHTLRQGQITSLFQKSVKRKEHEQRRRRKSKAQFFEMIQEIRRVQQEEKEEPKKNSQVGVQSSPRMPLRGFLTSPRTLKHLYNSKSTVSPRMSRQPADPLNPLDLLQHKRSSKSPSRLDIRRLSRELFSLPRSPKSPKTKSSASLDSGKPSSDEGKRKGEGKAAARMSDVRISAKDIRTEASKAVGRRLSRDASQLSNSPPDFSLRRKSHLDILQAKSLSASENVLDEASKSVRDLNLGPPLTPSRAKSKDSLSKSIMLTPFVGKPATLRLASGGNANVSNSARVRPRLPSPPKSPIVDFRAATTPKINVSDTHNLYDSIMPKEETDRKVPTRSPHIRSKSLDNKNFNFEAMVVDICTEEGIMKKLEKQTINYATLEHKRSCADAGKGKSERERSAAIATAAAAAKNATAARMRQTQDAKATVPTAEGFESCGTTKSVTSSAKDASLIYAEPQKIGKEKREEKQHSARGPESSEPGKSRVSPKKTIPKLKQVRACSAPESDRKHFIASVVILPENASRKKTDCTYYSERGTARDFGSFPERHRRGVDYPERCFETLPTGKKCAGISPRKQHGSSGRAERKGEMGRSRSVPEQRTTCPSTCRDAEQLAKTLRFLQQASKSLDVPTRNPGILKERRRSKSRDEVDWQRLAPPSPGREHRKRGQETPKREQTSSGRRQSQLHLEPP